MKHNIQWYAIAEGFCLLFIAEAVTFKYYALYEEYLVYY